MNEEIAELNKKLEDVNNQLTAALAEKEKAVAAAKEEGEAAVAAAKEDMNNQLYILLLSIS